MNNKKIEVAYTLFRRQMRFSMHFSSYSDPNTQFQQACYTLKQLTLNHKKLHSFSTAYYSSKECQIREMLHLISDISLLSSVYIERVVCHNQNLTTILYDHHRSYDSNQEAHPHLNQCRYESRL